MDKFQIQILNATRNPQQLAWGAMHQDYSEDMVWEERDKFPDEAKAGELIVKYLLSGGRGHFGCLEHPQITLSVGYFPHSTMQQIRTHRVGISIDCQSFRYTSQGIIDVAEGKRNVEEVFYLRPVGNYSDRKGNKYFYSQEERDDDLQWVLSACGIYARKIERGVTEEHARGLIPFDIRQHFVLSCNARSLMHLLDLRWKKDAQLEAQCFSELLFERFKEWMPSVAEWYSVNRAKRARLSP